MALQTFWTKRLGADETFVCPAVPGRPHQRVQRALDDPAVTDLFGPYEAASVPATFADCTEDKRLKG